MSKWDLFTLPSEEKTLPIGESPDQGAAKWKVKADRRGGAPPHIRRHGLIGQRRKRRMMWGLWDVMLRWGMLDPRGYGPAYALEIYSHRLLRYLTPWLHLVAFGVNIALLGRGWVYTATLAIQVAVLLAALLGRFVPALPFRIAYYYVTVTASIAVGLWDRLRARTVPIGWEKVEGTR